MTNAAAGMMRLTPTRVPARVRLRTWTRRRSTTTSRRTITSSSRIGSARSPTASDVSTAAVARCAREAAARGLLIRTAVADLRTLDLGRFDAVVCMDSALPHLLSDEDLAAACASLHRSLVPGGLLLASTRDYDAAPTGDPPRRFADRTVEQIWEWEDDERYVLRHRIVRDGEVAERRTRYRALRRATLTAALRAAGFVDVEWPPTGFPQPVVSARTSSRATATSRTRR